MKARLAKVEGIGAKNLQLFEDLSADSPMIDSASIALLTDQYPGSTPDEPMAFICLNSVDSLPANKPPEVKTQVKLITTHTFGESLPRNILYPSLIHRLAAAFDAPVWLPIAKGEILLSDGIKVIKKDYTKSMSACND